MIGEGDGGEYGGWKKFLFLKYVLLVLFFRWNSENTGYFTHLIDVVFSLAFYYVLFYGDLFLSLPQPPPPPLLGVGISGICTDGFP